MQKEVEIFISYKREERALADFYRKAFMREGYRVVTDIDLNDGINFGIAIKKMIESARVVVVLWTEASTQSEWVLSEAELAISLDKYIGAWLAEDKAPIALLPPGTFNRQHHMFEKGLSDDGKVRSLLEKIRQRIGPPIDPASAPAISDAINREMSIYQSVASLNKIEAYQGYIEAFPEGRFRDDALHEIRKLSSWRTRITPYMPSFSLLSLGVGIAGIVVGYMQVPPERWEIESAKTRISTLEAALEADTLSAAEVSEARAARTRAESALTSVIQDRDTARAANAATAKTLQDREAALAEALRQNSDLTRQNQAYLQTVTLLERERDTALQAVKDARTAADDAAAKTQASLNADLKASKARADKLSTDLDTATKAQVQTAAELRAAQMRLAQLERTAQAADEISIATNNIVTCKVAEKTGVWITNTCFSLDTEFISLGASLRVNTALSEKDLAGLAQLRNLKSIILTGRQNDFSHLLTRLPKLERLVADRTGLSSLDWTVRTPNLQTLFIKQTKVTSIAPLILLDDLRYLSFNPSNIKDLTPLKSVDSLVMVFHENGARIKDADLREWLAAL